MCPLAPVVIKHRIMYYPIYDINNFNFSIISGINPNSAGYLKTRIYGGGVNLTSLQIPCLMSKYDERCIIESSSALLWESAKNYKFAQILFFCEFQLFSKKCLQKSPWLIHVNFAKKIAKFKIWALLENIFSYVHCMHIDFLWSYCFSWNLSKSKVLIYSGHLYDVFSSYIAYLISVEVLLSGIVSEFLDCLSISFLVWTEYILVK